MAMKFICGYLLAVALLGCLAVPQQFKEPQKPPTPVFPPPPSKQHQLPQPPTHLSPPKQYQLPDAPTHLSPPKQYQLPDAPTYSSPPKQYQRPDPPTHSSPPKQYQRPDPPTHSSPPKQYQRPDPPTHSSPPKQYQRPDPPTHSSPPKQYQHQDPQVQPEVFHSCEVPDNHKIQCGAPDISASECEDINCCHNGRMCFYGKSVTLQCTKDGQFIVVVSKSATLPNIDLESISFYRNDPSCNPVGSTSAFAIYQFTVTSCGTVLREEPGVLIYENRMSSSFEVAVGPAGAITRDTQYDLLFQCRYIGTSVEAVVIEVSLLPPPPPVAAPGPLRVDLRLANGQCTTKGCLERDVAYNSYYEDFDYPITKVLRDPVYVEVRMLERTDPNIVLTLGRCWATADPYPHSLPQWDLLIDGCPYLDDRYQTTLVPVDASSGLMYPSHHKRFIFKMFTFVGTGAADPAKGGAAKGWAADPEVMTPLREQVYIHCNAAVCQPSLGDNCEPRCFRKGRDVSAAVKKSRPDATVVSIKGALILENNNGQ